MIWLSWRQQRLETVLTALLLALAAAALVPVGLHMASIYHHDGLAACFAHSSGCNGSVPEFTQRFEHSNIVPWLNFLPGLFGILFAAPFVLELEQGTFRLAWTQSVTRRRWLAVKLGTICVSGLVAAFALTTLMTWWRQPLDHLQGRMEQNVFDFEGVVPYAYTLFAIALAVALGVFTRRTVVASAGALLGYFVLRITILQWVRVHYLAPLKAVWSAGNEGPAHLATAWNLQSGPSDAHGNPLPNARMTIKHCIAGPKQQAEHCVSAHHIFNFALYQPASRFWLFQGIESAIFLGAAAVLLTAAVWWLLRRVS